MGGGLVIKPAWKTEEKGRVYTGKGERYVWFFCTSYVCLVFPTSGPTCVIGTSSFVQTLKTLMLRLLKKKKRETDGGGCIPIYTILVFRIPVCFSLLLYFTGPGGLCRKSTTD